MLYYHKDLKTISDVQDFFEWLLDEGINFHPENSFADFIRKKGVIFENKITPFYNFSLYGSNWVFLQK